MQGESQYYREPAGRCGCSGPFVILTSLAVIGLLLAVVTVHLAGPWSAVPGAGR